MLYAPDHLYPSKLGLLLTFIWAFRARKSRTTLALPPHLKMELWAIHHMKAMGKLNKWTSSKNAGAIEPRTRVTATTVSLDHPKIWSIMCNLSPPSFLQLLLTFLFTCTTYDSSPCSALWKRMLKYPLSPMYSHFQVVRRPPQASAFPCDACLPQNDFDFARYSHHGHHYISTLHQLYSQL